MAYAGNLAQIKVSGVPVTFTDEPTTTTDNKTYQITNAQKRVWDRDTPIVVEDGGVPTVEQYTVQHLTGTITFATVDATRVITVSGKYLPMAVAAEAKEFNVTCEAGLLDTTKFGQDWREKTPGLKSASGTISQWTTIDTYFVDALLDGSTKVLELYSQNTLNPMRFWVKFNSDELSAAIDGAQEESVGWESDGDFVV